jgi:hypothetical protein
MVIFTTFLTPPILKPIFQRVQDAKQVPPPLPEANE